MLFIVYIFVLVFLLILFILLTAIGLTFKLKILNVEEKKELQGLFTIKWLFFSHSFSFGEPEEKETSYEVPENLQTEEVARKHTESLPSIEETKRIEYKAEGFQEVKDNKQAKESLEIKKRESKELSVTIEDKRPIEKGTIEYKKDLASPQKPQEKEKTGLLNRIRGKKSVKSEEKAEHEEENITMKEMLHWGLEAYKNLRKPLFRLFSDLIKGIKFKRLKFCLNIGLSDPADTGILYGFIHSVAGLIYSRCRHCSFYITPVFMCPILDFNGSGEIRVKIHSVIFPFIKFILNRKTLSFTYSIAKEILQKKWRSRWKSRWESKWKFKWKSKTKSDSEAL